MLYIEVDDVVSDQEFGALGKGIQTLECCGKIASAKMECLAGIRSDTSEFVDLGVLAADLKVGAEAAGYEVELGIMGNVMSAARTRPGPRPGRVGSLRAPLAQSSATATP